MIPDRPTKSISAEDTFERDIPLAGTEALIRHLAEKVWMASRKDGRVARTIVLKLKTSEFTILTRSHTPGGPPESCEELTAIALSLRDRINLGSTQRFRLVGVGLSNFEIWNSCSRLSSIEYHSPGASLSCGPVQNPFRRPDFSRMRSRAAGAENQSLPWETQRAVQRIRPALRFAIAGSLTIEQTRLLVRDWSLIDFFRAHFIVREDP